MKVSLIAAVAANGTIGKHNQLPWRIRDDMRFFRDKTLGHVVISGRRNFEAMGGGLPKRRNLVVTRAADYRAERGEVCPTIEQALRVAKQAGETEAFVIGGAEIYALAFPYADTFYRTRVLAEVDGDVVFPRFDEHGWRLRELARHAADADNEHAFVIEELSRLGPAAAF